MTTTLRVRSTWSLTTPLTVVSLVTLGVLAGCQTVVDTAPSDQAASNGQAQLTTPEDSVPSDTSPPNSMMTFDWQDGAPEADSDAYLAWQALLGPDGEFAALASYQAVLDEFGAVEPYLSISEAEARHAHALIRQLERMGVQVPENPYFGQIEAPADLEIAATAWAEGEVLNVALYDELLAQTDDERLTRVFTNLRRASAEDHLPAFELAAENGGVLDAAQMAALGRGQG